MKGEGMLVVSLRGVNFGFCSHLGCSGENDTICSPYAAVKVSFRVRVRDAKKYKNIHLICFKYGLF